MNDHYLTSSPTVLGSWVLLVAKTINSYGLKSDAIFKDAGIDLADIKENDTRFPTAMLVKAWEIAAQKTQDPFMSIRVAHYFNPTVYSALGMSMVASRNVYDALKRCVRYFHLISDGTLATLEEADNSVAFVLKPRADFRSLTHIYGVSATLCCMHHIFREIAGESLKVKEVHFEDSLSSSKPLEDFFSCPVFYGADSNKIVFDKRCVFKIQLFTHPELTRSLDDWIEEYLTQNNSSKFSLLVQDYLLKNLEHGNLGQNHLARNLAMSTRKLQRKLSQEGTSYIKLLNNYRKKQAIKMVTKQKHSLSEVSVLLGFSCPSNFNRAFKRWTGTTPKKYRV